jgi:hypothetical protein
MGKGREGTKVTMPMLEAKSFRRFFELHPNLFDDISNFEFFTTKFGKGRMRQERLVL